MAALDALCTGWCHKFQGGGGELTGRIWERAALARARLARMDFGMACPGVALAPIRLHVYKLPLEVGLGLWLVTEVEREEQEVEGEEAEGRDGEAGVEEVEGVEGVEREEQVEEVVEEVEREEREEEEEEAQEEEVEVMAAEVGVTAVDPK
eukprot:gene10487-12404_t